MLNKIKNIKIRNEDGTLSEPIPIGANAKYVDTSERR